MGFEQPNIDECLRAAENDAQRAAEYLMTGIPDFVRMAMNAPRQTQQTQQTQQPQQPQQQQQTGAPSDLGGLAALMQQFPQFNQLRAAIQSNPHLLTPIMQRLAQSNPELVAVINQNPEEFIRLLNEPVQMPQQQQQQQGAFGGFGGMGFGGMPQQQQQQGMRPPPGTIMVTPQEKEAIDRLVGMGFDRTLAVQAFFACGKDENLAANFLLENPELLNDMNDDDEGGQDEGMNDQQ
jgi:UV excision repair protein RAD23